MIDLSHWHLSKIQSMADGWWKLTIETPELSTEQAVMLMKAKQDWITDFKVPTTSEDEPKTKSQRLRAVIFRLWEQEYKATYPEFEVFYNSYLDKMINNVKDKLS